MSRLFITRGDSISFSCLQRQFLDHRLAFATNEFRHAHKHATYDAWWQWFSTAALGAFWAGGDAFASGNICSLHSPQQVVRHRVHAAAQVLHISRTAVRLPMLLGADWAAFALVAAVPVRRRHHHPTTSRLSWPHKLSAAVAAQLVLRLPASPVSRLSGRHVVHPVFVASSVVRVAKHHCLHA